MRPLNLPGRLAQHLQPSSAYGGTCPIAHINRHINNILLQIYLKLSGTSEASDQEPPAICNRSKTEIYNLQGKVLGYTKRDII